MITFGSIRIPLRFPLFPLCGASSTLTGVVGSVSLLARSCHDGKIATDDSGQNVLNEPVHLKRGSGKTDVSISLLSLGSMPQSFSHSSFGRTRVAMEYNNCIVFTIQQTRVGAKRQGMVGDGQSVLVEEASHALHHLPYNSTPAAFVHAFVWHRCGSML